MDPLIKKKQILVKLKSELPQESINNAIEDPHSRRRPRPCGLTIHPGRGCTLGCVYCYVQDMGFGKKVDLSPLSGEELVTSLLMNPWFVPGRNGTFLAFGSICEPFHPKLYDKTLEFLDVIDRWLGNPCQISTKMRVDEELAQRLSNFKTRISPLVSVTTQRKAGMLELGAPSPEERFKGIRNLAKHGLNPMIFLRPIIPNVTEVEFQEIIRKAKNFRAEGIVIGSLKVSDPIKNRLIRAGIDIEATLSKLDVPLAGDNLVNVPLPKVKRNVSGLAKELGLIPFYSACCANAYNAGIPCQSLCWNTGFCTDCPNNCPEKIPKVDKRAISRDIARILKVKPVNVDINKYDIKITLPFSPDEKMLDIAKTLLKTITRRRIDIVSRKKIS